MAAPPQLQALLKAVNALLRKRRYHAALALIKGFRNGIVCPCACSGPSQPRPTPSGSDPWALIPDLSSLKLNDASSLLASISCSIKRKQSSPKGKSELNYQLWSQNPGPSRTGHDLPLQEWQINMYLTSRVLFALCRLGVEKGYIPELRWDPFPLYTAVVWGLVLWLFEYHRPTLQPSLQSSMTYLYEDSNVWHDLSDFLIYNKSRASK
ncbi:peroxisomal membrane protein 4 isoform X2 [Marmota monax]|uniref:peroxisomal membrane protein 4 isoform X2 n=1 Tax=Marmota monax TaxID=9995 RepID=UPI001EAFC0B1|nr:peroxisomal membrane protein 4 isoform X2 [Marmota monax]